MSTDACERLRNMALAGVQDGTEAISAFICIAGVAQAVKDDACCLRTLSDVLESQRVGLRVVQTSEADRKADQVAAYIQCLLRLLENREV